MTNFFYRIRTLESIFERGELENQEIFFQEPEKLNDPMEGFIDFVYKGDEVVWKNFFKYYITYALAVFFTPRKNISFREIEVILEEHDKDKVIQKYLTEEIIEYFKEFITKLSNKNTPIKKEELEYYLYLLYDDFRIVFQKVLFTIKKINKEYATLKESHLNNAIKLIDSNDNNEHLKLFFENSYNVNQNIAEVDFLYHLPPVFLNIIKELTFPKTYIASFLEEPSNSSVWGNYGKNHTGVCLIFESNNNSLTLSITNENMEYPFEKINYNSDFNEINFFESLGLINGFEFDSWYVYDGNKSILFDKINKDWDKWRDEHWDRYMHNVLIKTKDWKYEKEYRILVKSILSYEIPLCKLKLKYNFNNLKGIIFGIRTPIESQNKIVHIIKSKCEKNNIDFKNFEFYRAYYCQKSKNIQKHKINIKTK